MAIRALNRFHVLQTRTFVCFWKTITCGCGLSNYGQMRRQNSSLARDHDFLQVPLNEGWLSVLIEGRQPVPLWAEKKVRFVRGGFSQTLQNGEPETLRLVEVEFIQNVGVERCGPEAQVSCNCSGYSGGIVRINSCGVLETDDFAINQLENHGERLRLSIVPTLVVATDIYLITSEHLVFVAASAIVRTRRIR